MFSITRHTPLLSLYLTSTLYKTKGYIGEFEIVDDHRAYLKHRLLVSVYKRWVELEISL